MYNPLNLEGKRIMVTGASSGIGRACAEVISRLGGNVILVARNEQRLAETLSCLDGADHYVDSFDLTDIDSISSWMKDLTARTGTLDGLIHCAGIQTTMPMRSTKLSVYEDLMKINVTSAFSLAKAFRQKNVYNPMSSIIFISSVAAVKGKAGIVAYSTSKSALLGMTKSLAAEYARDKIRVNCLVVGHVETKMAEEANKKRTDDQVRELANEHLLGLGKPEDVANSVVFLLAETGRWITGSNLVVDGGYSIN